MLLHVFWSERILESIIIYNPSPVVSALVASLQADKIQTLLPHAGACTKLRHYIYNRILFSHTLHLVLSASLPSADYMSVSGFGENTNKKHSGEKVIPRCSAYPFGTAWETLSAKQSGRWNHFSFNSLVSHRTPHPLPASLFPQSPSRISFFSSPRTTNILQLNSTWS